VKAGDLLRVRRTGTFVRSSPNNREFSITAYAKGHDNHMHTCVAGEVLMYMGECHPRNYYKVLCERGVGWIFWTNVDVVDGEHVASGISVVAEDVEESV
jgi:hypothetical protein